MLLISRSPDAALLEALVSRLTHLLGAHPDVNALAIRLAEMQRALSQDIPVFDAPPMLRNSWDIVVSASAARPDLVPVSSFAAQISSRIWGGGAWLVWQNPPERQPRTQPADIVDLRQALPELEHMLSIPGAIEEICASYELTDLEQSLLQYIYYNITTKPHPEAGEEVRSKSIRSRSEDKLVSELSLINALRVPNAAARQAAAGLIEKLKLNSEE